jgi:hypothetical protein
MQECTFGGFLHDLQVRGSINCAYDDVLAEFAFTQERMRDEFALAFMIVANSLYPDWRIR